MAKTYWEKLQDPKWQKKRLEVMNNASFCCEICGNSEFSLNVHHKEYISGREPWEYELNQLVCLCKSCHDSEHFIHDAFRKIVSTLPVDGPYSKSEVLTVLAGLTKTDYYDFLRLIDGEDCVYIKRMYDIGLKARNQMYGGKYD